MNSIKAVASKRWTRDIGRTLEIIVAGLSNEKIIRAKSLNPLKEQAFNGRADTFFKAFGRK
ncbi:MAG: hypothetical protein ICV68_12725 [Pyrinomonadaceae bacterium]|nr:hypothetical protein [Pyrinomonadaceae bacterium]